MTLKVNDRVIVAQRELFNDSRFGWPGTIVRPQSKASCVTIAFDNGVTTEVEAKVLEYLEVSNGTT